MNRPNAGRSGVTAALLSPRAGAWTILLLAAFCVQPAPVPGGDVMERSSFTSRAGNS